ncbi:MAG: hypothetical protein KKD44_27870 [Proteobacteria bacterium]|nr:hypothetical protein [Pseudomonadota bacterium]
MNLLLAGIPMKGDVVKRDAQTVTVHLPVRHVDSLEECNVIPTKFKDMIPGNRMIMYEKAISVHKVLKDRYLDMGYILVFHKEDVKNDHTKE